MIIQIFQLPVGDKLLDTLDVKIPVTTINDNFKLKPP